MQRSALCTFLHGPATPAAAAAAVRDFLQGSEERQAEIHYYKKDGRCLSSIFRRVLVIVPLPESSGEIQSIPNRLVRCYVFVFLFTKKVGFPYVFGFYDQTH